MKPLMHKSGGSGSQALFTLLACCGAFHLAHAVQTVSFGHAGSVDEAFRPGAAPDGQIRCILPLADGRVLVGGDFRLWNGVSVPPLVRLNEDGSFDPKFRPQLSSWAWFGISGLWQHRDGKILVAGSFDSVAQKPRGNFVRLTAEGEDDPTFAGFVDGEVNDVALAEDGSMYIAGGFNTVNGVLSPGVARLTLQGQLDPAFQPPLNRAGTGLSATRLADGDVLVAGLTTEDMDPPLFGLIRFSDRGEIDPGYYLESPSFFARRLESFPGGARALVHSFGVVRLMPDGGLDPLFDLSRVSTFPPTVTRTSPDGRLLVAGDSLIRPDGSPARLLRLFENGQIDATFRADLDFTPRVVGFGPGGVIYAAGNIYGPSGDEKRIVRLRGNDSSAPPTLQWNAAQLGFPAAANVLRATLIRDGNLSQPCLVQVVTRPGAPSDSFVPFEAAVQFEPGEAFKTISIPGLAQPPPGPEQLILAEIRAIAGGTPGTNTTLALHFLQDQGTIALGLTNLVAGEPAGSIAVPVQRQGALAYSVRATWTLQSVQADPAAYFAPTSGSVLFTPGVTNTYLTVPLFDNATADGDKTFSLQLGLVSRHFQLGHQAQCDIGVLENDQPGFPGDGIDGPVHQMVVQPDGKVLLGGTFRSVHGLKRGRFARLLMDGTLDESFEASVRIPPLYDTAQDLELAPDGKVLISGAFTNVSGVDISRIARLNPDGSLDDTFAPVPNVPRTPTDLAVSPNGQVLAIGGGADFNGARDGLSLGGIARFNLDGSRDTNFATTTYAGSEGKLLALDNGRFLAGGSILVYSNALPAGRTSPKPGVFNPILRRTLARFQNTGELDPAFNVTFLGQGGTRGYSTLVIADMLNRGDGRILLAGGFTNVNSQAAPGLVQLLPDGTVDQSFQAEIDRVTATFSLVRSIALGPKGTLAAVIEDGGLPARLAQFDANGRFDAAFGVHAARSVPSVVAIVPNGDVFWAGNFTAVDGSRRYRIARFHPDGWLAPDGALGFISAVRTSAGGCELRLESRLDGRVQVEKSNDLRTWTPISNQQIFSGAHDRILPAESAQIEFYRAVVR